MINAAVLVFVCCKYEGIHICRSSQLRSQVAGSDKPIPCMEDATVRSCDLLREEAQVLSHVQLAGAHECKPFSISGSLHLLACSLALALSKQKDQGEIF